MKKVFSKDWFFAAGIRALKTVAQTAVGIIGAATIIEAVDWKTVVSASVLAGVLSMLTSLAGLPELTDEKKGDHTL